MQCDQNKRSFNQVLILGKSDFHDRSKITCTNGLDIPEVLDDQVPQVAPIPDTDIEDNLDPVVKKWYEERGKTGNGESMSSICENWGIRKSSFVENKGKPGMLKQWLKPDQSIEELDVELLGEALTDSNERAWWLRTCCATTAKFNN